MIVFTIIISVELGYIAIKLNELIRAIQINNNLQEYKIVNKKDGE